jgi:indolepyruvate ferredoxin oxidoreductase beta subunit
MSQRGGSVFSHVRFGKKVFSPTISLGEADVLISLEEMETLRWISFTNEKTTIVYSQHRIMPGTTTVYPEGIEAALQEKFTNLISIDPKKILEKTGNAKFYNVVILGIIADRINLPLDVLEAAIRESVPTDSIEKNMMAFQFGRELASS